LLLGGNRGQRGSCSGGKDARKRDRKKKYTDGKLLAGSPTGVRMRTRRRRQEEVRDAAGKGKATRKKNGRANLLTPGTKISGLRGKGFEHQSGKPRRPKKEEAKGSER